MGPCMLHNPSYDFNDDLIPLGATLWVRLAEAWLADAARALTQHERRRARFAQSYAEARGKFLAAADAAGLDVAEPRAPAARPRRRDAGDGRGARRARATPRALLIVSSACHGVEGFCGSGVQVALLRDAAWRAAAARSRRGRALRPRAQPLRLLVVAAHDARERRPEPQLPRLQPAAAGATPAYDEIAALLVPDQLAADRRGRARRSQRYIAEHGVRGVAGGDRPAASTTTRRACSTAASTRPGATSRCATCCASTAGAAQRLGWIDLHTGLGPSGARRAHLRLPRRRRGAGARARLVGRRRSPRSTTAARPRRC